MPANTPVPSITAVVVTLLGVLVIIPKSRKRLFNLIKFDKKKPVSLEEAGFFFAPFRPDP